MDSTLDFLPARPPRLREKVYGRRRQGPLETRDANLKLFAGVDTNDIVKGIENLSVSVSSNNAESIGRPRCKTSRVRPASNRPDECHTPAKSTIEEQPSRPHVPLSRRPGSRRQPRLKTASLTEAEAASLQPVLAFERTESKVYDFESWSAHLSKDYEISKLSEGSYSDCFICRKQAPEGRQVVLKIIPFSCESSHSTEIATHAQGFLREVKVLAALEPYHGFAQIYNSRIVKGRMAPNFIEAARSWLETTTEDVDKSINPATRYAENQMFGVIEMAFAGQDLELLTRPSAFQAFDAFWMTAILIANAENSIQFEHRDLHMSNICFKAGPTGRDDVSTEFVKRMVKVPSTTLGLSGLEINIIDYTHSRMKGSDERVLYNPDAPFTSADLEIYGEGRIPCDQMDTVIKIEQWTSRQADQQEGVSKYAGFTPKTNVIWLSHVLMELTKHALTDPKKSYIQGSSAQARTLQVDIWKQLKGVLDIIGSDDLDTIPAGTENLIKLAVEKAFIGQGDVDAFKSRLNDDSASPEK